MNNFMTIWGSKPFQYIILTICLIVFISFLSKKFDSSCVSDSTKEKGKTIARRTFDKVVDSYV